MQLFLINFQKKFNKIQNNQLQKKYSKFFVQYILKNFFNINDSLKKEEDGKPYLEKNSFKISISHSEDLIAILFDKNDCGVDIEKIKQRNYEKILSRFNIQKKLSLKEFYQWWTIFEAEFKSKIKQETINFEYKNFICGISSFDKSLVAFEINFKSNHKDFLFEKYEIQDFL